MTQMLPWTPRASAVLALLIAATAGAGLQAQQPGLGLTPAPPAEEKVKIGLVNVGVLLRDQDKVKAYKAELDIKIKPLEDRSKQLEQVVTGWIKALRDPKSKMSDDERQKGNAIVLACRREMEDLEKQYRENVGCDLGGKLLSLDKEIKHAIKIYAEEHHYHLILAFGEPDVPLPPLRELGRRMTGVDAGQVAIVPLIDGVQPMDVTRGVMDILNSSFRASRGLPK